VPAAVRANLNARFGLDKPVWVDVDAVDAALKEGETNPITLARAFFDSQYFNYLARAARLDLGPSYQSRGATEVRDVIGGKFPVSLKIGLVGLAFAIAIGVPLGVAGALRQGSWLDHLTLGLSSIGLAVPGFVTGVLAIVLLSTRFDVSPLRRPDEWAGFGLAYLLPGIVLGLGLTAVLVRLTRASLLETSRQDFVRTARAKGLRERRVVRAHLLRNSLIPVVTVLGPAAADLVTGSIIIEAVFNAPGLGREYVKAIGARDYSMIMGTTLFYAVAIALANLAVDLSYAALDPRIRIGR
jgi:oligopeptide transport system permease protein